MPFDSDAVPAATITYDGAGGLFTEIGKMIGGCKSLEYICEHNFEQIKEDIETPIEPARLFIFDGLTAAFDLLTADVLKMRRSILDGVKKRLQDRPTVVNQLSLDTDDLNVILPRLREKMVVDGKTVQKNVVTIAAVAAAATNIGNGTILTTKVLDGYSAPGSPFPADKRYAGIDSELSALWETITIECSEDSNGNGTTGSAVIEGREKFRVFGNPVNPADSLPTPYFGSGVEGSGETSARAGDNNTVISNGSFDSWTDAAPPVPSPWVIDSGVNGTSINKETINIFRRSGSSLKLVGDGTATIQLSNQPASSLWRPLRRYVVSVRYKASAAVAAGTLGVEFSGTLADGSAYAPGTDKISIAPGALSTVWALASFQVTMPSVVPLDWKLILKVTGTLTATKIIYIDDVIVQPVNYFGGVGFVVVPGSIPTMKRDRWTFLVENDRAGNIQSFWNRAFGRQLPSSAAPNINDDLALMSEVASEDSVLPGP